jgi:ParB-like chromosome segregation protein Spo0J
MTTDPGLTIAMAKRIELWPVERLQPYERNARTHSAEQVAQIAASIVEFGFTNPILVDSNDGIIAGHGRLTAAQELGLRTVPVVVLDHLSDRQRKAYILADNQLALNAGWDTDLLRGELQDLAEQDFDLSLIGFSDDELADLLPEIEELPPEGADEEAVPEPPADPVTKPGDVWLLGKHRVMCGDSTSLDEVERLMAGAKADMVFTDPPYGMKLQANYHRSEWGDRPNKHSKGNQGNAHRNVAGDHDDFTPELISTVFACFPDCSEVFLWGADYYAEHIPQRNEGSWVVWDKVTNSQGEESGCAAFHGSNFELCWSKAKHKRELARIMHKGLASVENDKRVHPTQKPVALAQWFFERWGNGRTVVADLYGGSGSTLIACEKTGRQARLMELDPRYCDVIVKRWQQFTGKTAKLEGTGEPFPADA